MYIYICIIIISILLYNICIMFYIYIYIYIYASMSRLQDKHLSAFQGCLLALVHSCLQQECGPLTTTPTPHPLSHPCPSCHKGRLAGQLSMVACITWIVA